MSKNEILRATVDLLWERGYEATSPAAILERSGAGKGSFYHHFESKRELARTAIDQIEAELIRQAEEVLADRRRPGAERVHAWLELPRPQLRGCRLGRLVQEQAVQDDPALRDRIAAYFVRVQMLLVDALHDATANGDLVDGVDEQAVAALLVATVQGAYVLARAANDPAMFDLAIHGAVRLFSAVRRV